MEVKIIKLQSLNEDTCAEFSSEYGTAKGLWKDRVPETNQNYYVEVDIPQTLIWGVDIIKTDCKEYKICNNEDNILLNVQLECLDDCITVRLGNSLILLETDGVPCSVGAFLKIQAKEIFLYPYKL